MAKRKSFITKIISNFKKNIYFQFLSHNPDHIVLFYIQKKRRIQQAINQIIKKIGDLTQTLNTKQQLLNNFLLDYASDYA